MTSEEPKKKKKWKQWQLVILVLVIISVSYYGITKWIKFLHWVKDKQVSTPIVIPKGK